MGIGSFLLGFALLLIVALYVGRPFLQGYTAGSETLSEREALQVQKEGLLEQIRLLDFEHETGKIPDEEHSEQRAALLHEAAAVLKALDNLAVRGVKEPASPPAQDIEAAIAAVRQNPHSVRTPAAGDIEIEAAVQQMRRPRSDVNRQSTPVAASNGTSAPAVNGRFCANCGKPREAADRFCAYCGSQFT